MKGRLVRQRSWRIIRQAVHAFSEDQALTHGAAIAFFTGLSLAPILILLIWVSAALGPDMRERLVEQVELLLGPQGGEVVRIVIENANANVDTGNVAGWLSLVALLFSATAVFAQLQNALNSIWGITPSPSGLGILRWLRKRLVSLGLILSLGFLLLVSLVVSSALSALSGSMKSGLPTVLWNVCDLLIPFLVYVASFMALFLYLPDAMLRWRHVWFGAVVTALLFVVGKRLIGYYLGTSALGSSYGAAGSLVLMLLWTYYSSAIVLFGAELTRAYIRERGETVPKDPLDSERAPMKR